MFIIISFSNDKRYKIKSWFVWSEVDFQNYYKVLIEDYYKIFIEDYYKILIKGYYKILIKFIWSDKGQIIDQKFDFVKSISLRLFCNLLT